MRALLQRHGRVRRFRQVGVPTGERAERNPEALADVPKRFARAGAIDDDAARRGLLLRIVRLHGGTPRQAELAAITLVGTLLGMICDGAKESCGLKVSNAASEAWSAAMLALENRGIRNTQGIISPDIHELGITLREFNEKIFSAADSVMIGLMTRQNRSAESRA